MVRRKRFDPFWLRVGKENTLVFLVTILYIYETFERFLKMNNSIQYIILYVRQLVINLHLKWIKKNDLKKNFEVRIEVFQGYLIK